MNGEEGVEVGRGEWCQWQKVMVVRGVTIDPQVVGGWVEGGRTVVAVGADVGGGGGTVTGTEPGTDVLDGDVDLLGVGRGVGK